MAYTEEQVLKTKERLFELRKSHNITATKMPQELSDYMTGACLIDYEETDPENATRYRKTKGMSIEKLVAIADYYNVSVDYLLGRTDDKTNDFTMIEISKKLNLPPDTLMKISKMLENDTINQLSFTLFHLPDNTEYFYNILYSYFLFNVLNQSDEFMAEEKKKLTEIEKELKAMNMEYRLMDEEQTKAEYRKKLNKIFNEMLDYIDGISLKYADTDYSKQYLDKLKGSDILNEIAQLVRERN
ncbi:MAG: hypothetical protein Q4D51_04190 [Eubacteriales bacterium]|nr:hypothetical protein [Eubacteriales bacterium]